MTQNDVHELKTEATFEDVFLLQDLEFTSLINGPGFDLRHLNHERRRVTAALQAGGWGLGSTGGQALMRPLTWDSQHFGVSAAELSRLYWLPSQPLGSLQRLVDACHRSLVERDVQWIVARLRCDQLDALHHLENLGLRLMDTSLELGLNKHEAQIAGEQASNPSTSGGVTLREGRHADGEELSRVAATFTENRFHRDPRIDDDSAAGVYRQWVSNAAAGLRQNVLVAEVAGRLAGFCTYQDASSAELDVGTIGLLTVAPEFRGRGIARSLVDGAVRKMNACRIVSSTQVENFASQRTFASLGFKTLGARHTLHGWLRP